MSGVVMIKINFTTKKTMIDTKNQQLKPGLIYFSSLPANFFSAAGKSRASVAAKKLRCLLESHVGGFSGGRDQMATDSVGRIVVLADDDKHSKRQAWAELMDSRVAKLIAEKLKISPDISCKYLPTVRWHHLTQVLHSSQHKKANLYKQRMAKRHLKKQVEKVMAVKGRDRSKIESVKSDNASSTADSNLEKRQILKQKFRQRQPV